MYKNIDTNLERIIIIIFNELQRLQKLHIKGCIIVRVDGSQIINPPHRRGSAAVRLISEHLLWYIWLLIVVDVGHYAIKFNKFTGLSAQRYREGYNFKFPIIENPIIYNVQTR